MLSLSVKRSCFHTKAQLVFHCCLYNKIAYQLKSVILKKYQILCLIYKVNYGRKSGGLLIGSWEIKAEGCTKKCGLFVGQGS